MRPLHEITLILRFLELLNNRIPNQPIFAVAAHPGGLALNGEHPLGDHVESLLYRLIQEAGGDLATPQRGFFYIDEIDKLGASGTGGKDMRLGVRQDQAHEHRLVL
jgi:hypothetical protein